LGDLGAVAIDVEGGTKYGYGKEDGGINEKLFNGLLFY